MDDATLVDVAGLQHARIWDIYRKDTEEFVETSYKVAITITVEKRVSTVLFSFQTKAKPSKAVYLRAHGKDGNFLCGAIRSYEQVGAELHARGEITASAPRRKKVLKIS